MIFKVAFLISACIIGIILVGFTMIFGLLGICVLVRDHMPDKLKSYSNKAKTTTGISVIAFIISVGLLLQNKTLSTWGCLYVFVANCIVCSLLYGLKLIHESELMDRVMDYFKDKPYGSVLLVMSYSLFIGIYLFPVLVITLSQAWVIS